jgi:hypothetical protein
MPWIKFSTASILPSMGNTALTSLRQPLVRGVSIHFPVPYLPSPPKTTVQIHIHVIHYTHAIHYILVRYLWVSLYYTLDYQFDEYEPLSRFYLWQKYRNRWLETLQTIIWISFHFLTQKWVYHFVIVCVSHTFDLMIFAIVEIIILFILLTINRLSVNQILYFNF